MLECGGCEGRSTAPLDSWSVRCDELISDHLPPPSARLQSCNTTVWNTLWISEIVNQLLAASHTIANQDLARVSPLMHTHVILNGTYRFSDEEEPERMYGAAS